MSATPGPAGPYRRRSNTPANRPARLGDLVALRGHERRRAGAAVAIGSAGQLAGVGLLASSAWLITTASLRPPVLTLTVAIAAVQFFALIRGVARYGERLASHDLAFSVLARLRVWVFARLEPLVPARWPGTQRGDLLSRFVADVDGVQDLYVRALLPLAASVTTAAATAVTATLLDRPAGLVLAAGLLAGAVAVPALAGVGGARGGTQLAERRGRRDALIVEMLHSADELAVLGAVPSLLARLDTTERHLARQARRAALAASLGAASSTGLPGLLTAAVIAASLPALHAGAITGTTVAVLGFLGFGGAEATSGLPEGFAALATTLAGARRILALAGRTPAARPAPTPAHPPAAERARPAPGVARPPTIDLDDVTVAYEPGRPPALHHASLHLEPGCHLAVVGQSGAGKTTLGHLLLRFVEPSAGWLRIDGAGADRLDPDVVRQSIAWAPQDPHIFHTSLAANLRLARPDATDTQLTAVVEQIGLGPWLAGLPDGLDTVLGERGATVSGGERQRLGVARVLLAERPVLILDEPTAHLDTANELLLRHAVLDATTAKTLVWITHRHTGLGAFDQIATMHQGRLALGHKMTNGPLPLPTTLP